MEITAKPVVDNRYWILRSGDRKVGNIQAVDDGYAVRIHDQVETYKSIRVLKHRVKIDFEKIPRSQPQDDHLVYGYDVGCRAYNVMYDVRQHLPLFTQSGRSKSWLAAGWYAVKQNNQWSVMRNPKLIILQRYEFAGPYHQESQAHEHSHQ